MRSKRFGGPRRSSWRCADENQRLSDLPWTMSFVGNNNGNTLLEEGEKAEMTVWLMDRATGIPITANDSIAFMDGSSNGGGSGGLASSDILIVKSTRFVLELTPQLGAPLTIQRAIPPGLRNVMNLN